MAQTTKESSLEEQMKTMQRHFGGIVSTVKDLKATVDALKKQVEGGEVQEIVETQTIIDELVVANSDSIKQIKSEIKQLRRKDCVEACDEKVLEGQNEENIKDIIAKQQVIDKSIMDNSNAIKIIDKEIKCIVKDKTAKDKCKKDIEDAINRLDDEILHLKKDDKASNAEIVNNVVENKMKKKCKYYNAGHCKYKLKCRFAHPNVVCKDNKCDGKNCPNRHPKACKWQKEVGGCRRKQFCDYSHDTLVSDDDRRKTNESEMEKFECVGCKHEWEERQFVVMHNIHNMDLYFCLNCDDWIKYKGNVLDIGWSLFDTDGNLSYNV